MIKEKYDSIFDDLFGEDLKDVNLEELEFGEAGWDSVMTMDLIAMMEQEFNIRISNEDKMSLESYQSGINLLKKYKVIKEVE